METFQAIFPKRLHHKSTPKNSFQTSFLLNSILLLIFIILPINYLSAQNIPNDSLKVEKKTGIVISETIGLNLLIWSADRYVAKAEWAYISTESIKENLQTGFIFDDSEFLMNNFLHPYHGSLYFNAARYNGFSFWESIPFVFFGSSMWEIFLETESPSNNDLLTTTMGGIMMGEITWRLSSIILDNNDTGSTNIWREVAAGLINPVRGLNRLINKKPREYHHKAIKRNNQVFTEISTRGYFFDQNSNQSDNNNSTIFKMQFIYGSPLTKQTYRKPFDYFNLNLGINLSGKNLINNFYGEALLIGKNFSFKKNDNSLQNNLAGLFQHYDFITNDTYKLTASGIGGGIISCFPTFKNLDICTSIQLSSIIPGGSNSTYAEKIGRDYNLGPGLSGKLEGKIIHDKFGNLSFNYVRYWIYTLSGAKGSERIDLMNSRIELPVNSKLQIGMEYLLYSRQGKYDYHENIKSQDDAIRTFISYQF